MSEISMKSPPEIDGRRQRMRMPDEVVAILRLHDGGWGTRKIAREVGCDRETVKRYLASGRWASCRVSKRPGVLDEHAGWIAERFTRRPELLLRPAPLALRLGPLLAEPTRDRGGMRRSTAPDAESLTRERRGKTLGFIRSRRGPHR